MNLPIEAILPQLQQALAGHVNAVLQAAPGAGKTTRVPLVLLAAPWLRGRKIILLEPRRLAARTAAHYMAQSLGESVGQTVGYRVRLDSRVSAATRIEVVTEGVLTRMLQSDPALEGVGLVIFDEFHERSLQADLGLALCLETQSALRDDLKLLLMSATIDGTKVAALLGDAPVISSAGRSFPVAVHHSAPPAHASRDQTLQHVVSAVLRAMREEYGSILVFLPGTGEIRRVEQWLQAQVSNAEVMITPLYGELSIEAQEQAIRPAPAGKRKVVLATNIAETSLTIEGIRIVIDAGLARVPRFDPNSGLTRLETVNVSQAAADQRCGRAGRLESGVCYRLWPEGRHLLPYASPEILEADLAPLTLELAQWGCRDPQQLAWLDPPPAAAYAQAQELLQRLGALDNENRVTAHGREMAALPVHPRLAHMILRGRDIGAGAQTCALAALLSERDVLRTGKERNADMHTRMQVLHGVVRDEEFDRGALQRIKQTAAQWRRQLGISTENYDDALLGVLLAYAYPDRIAQRRSGDAGRYLLANGRGAVFTQHQSLADAAYLVIAQLEGSEREAKIFLATAISEQQIEHYFAAQIESREFVEWDRREEAVMARRQRCLGALVLEDLPLTQASPEHVTQALLAGIRQLGLESLPWDRQTRFWQARVQFLHRLEPEQWPDVSDQALMATLEKWLAPFVTGMSRRVHLAKLDLAGALNHLLSWQQQRALDELAPTHVQVPTGSRIALDYSNDPPVLAVRLQEMFGATDTPRIGGGKVKLLLHLLSPAQRPVQVTQDLAGFWRGSYHEVKKDLKGRYPKHYWPDDPLQAEPTRRAKPRPH
ncbi:MAG: ATP-dependent helicase HrpB [Gammaproteobacteria bacterium]|nr:ATP-dependent helicase HrpB [Gammaproteobacteria bacterium]